MTGLLTGQPGEVVRMVIPVLTGLLFHSTIITGAMLILLRIIRKRSAPVQTMVIRGGLAALFCIPVVQGVMTLSGIAVPLPGLEPAPIATYIEPVREQPESSPGPAAPPRINHQNNGAGEHTAVGNARHEPSVAESGTRVRTPDTAASAGTSRSNPVTQQSPQPAARSSRTATAPPAVRPDPSAVTPSSVNQSPASAPAEYWRRILPVIYGSVIIIWSIGMFLLLARMAAGFWYVRHLRRTARMGRTAYQRRCQRIARQLGIQPPFVYEHPNVVSTFLAGLTRPYIMIPANDTVTLLASEEVLIHELAHQKHHDIFWHIAGQVLLMLYPLQPLLWLIIRQAELISDYRADDYVVVFAEDNRSYARTLHDIACTLKHSGTEVRGYVPATGFFNRRSPLTARIMRILDRNRNRTLSAHIRDLVTLSVLLACTVVFTGFVRFEPAPRRTAELTSETSALSVETSLRDERLQPGQAELTDPESPDTMRSKHAGGGSSIPDAANGTGAETAAIIPAEILPELDTESAAATDDIIPANTPDVTGESTIAHRDPANEPDAGRTSGNEDTAHYVPSTDSREMRPETAETAPPPDNGEPAERTLAAENADTHADDSVIPDPGTGSHIGETGDDHSAAVFRGQAMPALAHGARIGMPAAKALNVIIEDYAESDFDLSDPEQLKQYLLYQSLENNHNEPAWSPDGSLIAFTDFSRIWVVPADGGEPQLVYENFHTDTDYTVGGIRALSFSADGHSLTFQKNTYDTERGSRFKEYDNGIAIFSKPVVNIERINLTTGEHEVLVQDAYQCQWSRSGWYLFFRTWNKLDDPSQGIWETHGQPMLLDVETSEMHPLAVPGDEPIGSAAFLPDDSAIIIPCREGTITDLWKIDLRTGGQTNLTADIPSALPYRHYDYPACSPNGKWVLFTDFSAIGEEINRRLKLLSLESGEVFDLEGEIQGNASHGIWSPDGRNICFLDETSGGSYLQVIEFYDAQYPVSKPAASEDEEAQPHAFDLVGNYPNPFNPSTRIEYGIESAGEVTLDIYNVLGQRVRRLVQETLPEGRHSTVWDGRDDHGMEAATGMYLARLVSGNRLATLKMTLQK